jgi:hypothetical protein
MRELKGDWRDLFHGFIISLDLRKMFLGFVGLVLTLLTVVPLTVATGALASNEFYVTLRDHFSLNNLPCLLVSAWKVIYCGKWIWGAIGYSVLAYIILCVIWSFFGGAICRIAAVEYARDERISLGQALHLARQKYGSCFWSAIACLIGFAFFYLIITLIALLGRIPVAGQWLAVLLMVFLFLAVLSGFLMVLIGIGTAFGCCLFYPAIAAEGTDSFDAISRGFSYVYNKPWHYIWYQFWNIVYGSVCVAFVLVFGWLVWAGTMCAGRLGMGDNFVQMIEFVSGRPHTAGVGLQIAGVVYLIWLFLFAGMLGGYVVSFCFTSQTILYFLLRKKVDGIEPEEIFMEEEEEELPPPPPLEEEKAEEEQPEEKREERSAVEEKPPQEEKTEEQKEASAEQQSEAGGDEEGKKEQ